MKLAEAKRCGTTLDVVMHTLTIWSVLEGLRYSLNLLLAMYGYKQ